MLKVTETIFFVISMLLIIVIFSGMAGGYRDLFVNLTAVSTMIGLYCETLRLNMELERLKKTPGTAAGDYRQVVAE